MGSKGSSTTTQQTTTAPTPQAMSLYQNILNQAQGVAQTPYRAYSGQLVAPVNAQQNLGIGNINANAEYASPYIQNAGVAATNAMQPLSQTAIQQYMSPYTQNVVNATQAQFNNQNQQQQQAVLGNAIAQGALGGNRTGVAQAELANQQNLAQAPVIAGLENQGYNQAVQTAMGEQGLGLQGANTLGNLGVAGQNAAIQGATAQIGAGTLQQQTQQALDAALLQQYQQQQAYPYQQLQWLAGIGTGVGSQMGGTSTGQTTTPAPNGLSSILGGITSGVGLLGSTGAFGSAGWLAPALAALARGGVANYKEPFHGVAANDTVPESLETLLAQQKQLKEGGRVAQLFPKGRGELRLPKGASRATMSNGDIFHYNPNKISKADLVKASKAGRENDVLGLGPYTKDEALRRTRSGEHPIAVVERNKKGTEVRAAAGTHRTASRQLRAMNARKSQGHHVALERPDYTISRRASGGLVDGVAHYDVGGTVPTNRIMENLYPWYAHGVAGVPWASASSYIPVEHIQHGPGAPQARAPAPYNPPQQDVGKQVASIGDLANSIKSSMDSSTNALPYGSAIPGAIGPTSVGGAPLVGVGTGIDPANYTGQGIYARGGVVGYDDGGTVDPLDSVLQGVAANESSGQNDPYTVLGPVTKTGDQAYGKYGIMGANIPEWTKEATGKSYTPQEFLANPNIQDQTARYKLGQYTQQYGPEGAARAWFAGPGNMNNPNAKDQLGTSVADYQDRFDAARGVAPLAFSGTPNDNSLPSEIRLGYSDEGTSPDDDADNTPQANGVAPSSRSASPDIDFGENSKLWPSLISAGFGMMASRSPFLGVAIGEGGEAGIASYNAQQMRDLKANQIAQQLELKRQEMMLPYQGMTQAQRADLALKAIAMQRPFVVGQDFMNRPIYAIRNQDGTMSVINPETGKLSPMGQGFQGQQGLLGPPQAGEAGAAPQTASPTKQGATPPIAGQPAQAGATPASSQNILNDPTLPSYMRPQGPQRDENFLARVQQQSPVMAALVKKVADYDLNPMSLSYRDRSAVLGLMSRYDPAYDQTLYNAKQRSMSEFFAGGPSSPAGTLTAGNTAILHAGEMYNEIDQMQKAAHDSGLVTSATNAVGSAGIPFVSYYANELRNAGARGTGTPFAEALSRWQDIKTRFTDEVTKFYAGSAGSEGERDRALEALNEAKSPAELKAAIQQDIRLMRDKVDQYQGRLIAGMNPGTWKAIANKDPSLVLTYKNARDISNKILSGEPTGQPTQPTGQPTQPAQPTVKPTLDQFLERARAANPGVSDNALRQYYAKKYGP